MITRKGFLGGLSASCAVAAFGSGRAGGRIYSVSLLGDTHYDKEPIELYHAEYVRRFSGKKECQWGFGEIPRNAKMWRGICKRILAASGKAVRPDCAFVLQTGDLIQGDCCDADVNTRMLDDTIRYFKSAYPKDLPFVTVCGNHDIRGLIYEVNCQIVKRYAEYMGRFESKELGDRVCGGRVTGSTFGFRQGPDLYVVIDFNHGSKTVPLVKRILAENEDARYTFIVLHGGVFPYDYWGRCFYLAEPKEDEFRREMRALFARRNAIVLAGHTHRLELREAKFPEGMITEMTVNTVDDPGMTVEPSQVRDGLAAYGADAKFLDKIVRGRELFAEYKPYMTRHYSAWAIGHAILRVSDDLVACDFYGGDALTPTKTFILRDRRTGGR